MKTVFVIDDDSLMREVLARLLEKSGYRVRAFQSAQLALPLIDSGYPDAIVSDVQMPGMTGLEFTRCVRERGLTVPVVLVTGTLVPDVPERARQLGVHEVFEKPIKDAARLSAVVDCAISKREEAEGTAGLDRLRLSFLTGLAHELRTPLTAIKLALENLFAARAADHRSAEGKLVAIGQRNLDRIIRLVEGQLDLLQITLGDVTVARRLVNVRDLLERAVSETQPAVRKRVVLEAAVEGEPILAFADPDRLRAVVRYLLEGASCDDARPVIVRYGHIDEGQRFELRFENIRVPARASGAAPQENSADGGVLQNRISARPMANGGGDPFETRAFYRVVASLCGEIRNAGDEGGARVSLRFPVLPRFDAREDHLVPLNSLREAAMLSCRTIALLKCEIKSPPASGSCFSLEEREFFQRCSSALSEGDALVRSGSDGTYFAALVERSTDEIEHITDFLRGSQVPGGVVEVSVEDGAPAAVQTEPAAVEEVPVTLVNAEVTP